MKKIIGFLLNLANRDDNYLCKRNFYEIKKHLLLKYGKMINNDYQLIEEECWTCEGTGTFKPTGKMCYHCGGTGFYKRFITILYVYGLGKYKFHDPNKRIEGYNPGFKRLYNRINIKSYISHKPPKYGLGREAFFILALFFDNESFRNEFGKVLFRGIKLTPFIIIEYVFFKTKHFKIKRPRIKKYRPIVSNEDIPF